jgi:hypothetical protein
VGQQYQEKNSIHWSSKHPPPELRVRYGLASQLAWRVERQVAATDKGRWTKVKKHAQHRRDKMSRHHFQGLDTPPTYSSPTVEYTYERDYTSNRQSHLFSGETDTTQSQPLCTTTHTLAAERHSWRQTSGEAHRAARETVECSREAVHCQTDHHAAPTCPDASDIEAKAVRLHLSLLVCLFVLHTDLYA